MDPNGLRIPFGPQLSSAALKFRDERLACRTRKYRSWMAAKQSERPTSHLGGIGQRNIDSFWQAM